MGHSCSERGHSLEQSPQRLLVASVTVAWDLDIQSLHKKEVYSMTPISHECIGTFLHRHCDIINRT